MGVSLRGMSQRRGGSQTRHNLRHHVGNTEHGAGDNQQNNYSGEERGFLNDNPSGLNLSPETSQLSNRSEEPVQYDMLGKPVIPHGNETFGDIMLHPTKQLALHKKRVEKFMHDHELAPEVAPETRMASPVHVRTRSVIHFKNLIGDQTIKMTDELCKDISTELSLSLEEQSELRQIKNTDGLAKVFRRFGREFSIKVHNSEDIHPEKKQTPAQTPELNEKAEQGHHYPLEQPATATTDQEKLNANNTLAPTLSHLSSHSDVAAARTSTDSERAHLAEGSAIIHLNSNVYLEVKKIYPEEDEEKFEELMPKRRAFFNIPDPDLSDEIGEESSASWLELFGDVFYVGWLTTFTHHNHITDGSTLANYVGWFVVMWWSWCSSALYSSRYDTGDVVHHIYKLIELCALVGMAGASNTYASEDHLGFVLGYIVSKAVLLIEYSVVFTVALITGSHGKLPLACYVFVNLLSIILWGASLAFGSDAQRASRFSLWYISIVIELLVNIALKKNKQVSVAGSHLAERFGLFTLIILGENMMGFITLVSEGASEDIKLICANMMGVIVIFGFFFMCFDDFSAQVLLEINVSQLWLYLHFPLHLCQVALGIALQDVIQIYGQHWDYLGMGCPSASSETSELPPANTAETSHIVQNVSGRALSLFQSLQYSGTPAEGASIAEGSASEAEGCLNVDFVFKTFLVSAGLVLMLNAFIKFINTPVSSRWSKYICASRAINAIIFFGLTQVVHQINSIGLLALLTGCLLFQLRSKSVRRGPTVRGRRPTIGRAGRRRQSLASDEEILTRSDSDTATEEVELHRVNAPPTYIHGDETFGDVIVHPVQQFEAHKQRKAQFEEQRRSWQLEHGPEKDDTKNLRAEQNFAIEYETAAEFGRKLKLTQKEKIMFNGVHDTESLTHFLHQTNRDYAIKVHHGHGGSLESHHAHHHQTLDLSSNIYVEFKPKLQEVVHEDSSGSTRRPFFMFPEADLSADIGEEKAASWLELFYDLFYIASLSEFTHTHVIKDWASLGVYASWFVIMWWAWTASSLYTSRFDTDDVMHHIYKLIEMCAVIGMAGTSDHFLNSSGFVYGYIILIILGISALKAILAIEYAIVFSVALMSNSKSRIPLLCYVVANLISIILWGISLLFLDSDTHFALWDNKRLSWAASHLAERFGLLTLIVLGENLMGFVKLVAEAGTTIHVVLRIYRLQYEKSHAESEPSGESSASNEASGVASAEAPTAAGSIAEPTSSSTTNVAKRYIEDIYHNAAYELAARAIEDISSDSNYYAPISLSDTSSPSHTPIPTMTSSILATVATVSTSVAYSTLAAIQQNVETGTNSSTEATAGDSEADLTPEEQTFVYKTFLITGGLILVINSLIKLLNTKLHGNYLSSL
ncbi:hypothetical protein NQZ79_g342 [Umbelopsis isabellina]|nr:hypothetical protein NQZ79_g342 [Umbelopsis isabellina]